MEIREEQNVGKVHQKTGLIADLIWPYTPRAQAGWVQDRQIE